MATVQVTTFAAFASAVAVQGDTIEVMNDLDIAAEYPNGYTSRLNIMCAQINGNGHAIKNIRAIDGSTGSDGNQCLFFFGVTSSISVSSTIINRLHFIHFQTASMGFWNGCWGTVTFQSCHFDMIGGRNVWCNFYYSGVSSFAFQQCWFDLTVTDDYEYFAGCGYSSYQDCRLDFANCVVNFKRSEPRSTTASMAFLFGGFSTFNNSVIMGVLDAEKLSQSSTKFLDYNYLNANINIFNSYMNLEIANTQSLTKTITLDAMNGYSYPHQLFAVNTDKIAPGITVTGSNDRPFYNTDAQMKAGRGLDIPENPSDTEWRIDPAYNNGYPYFVFTVPELQALWAYNPVPIETENFFFGNKKVKSLYYNGNKIKKLYYGQNLIFQDN